MTLILDVFLAFMKKDAKGKRNFKLYLWIKTGFGILITMCIATLIVLMLMTAFVIISAVANLFDGNLSIDDLLKEDYGSVRVGDMQTSSINGSMYTTGGIDYNSLPTTGLIYEEHAYKPSSLRDALMLRELAIEICSRPEINLNPAYLLGIWYTECSLNMELEDTSAGIYQSVSTINKDASTQFKGPAQTNAGAWINFGTGYISKAENATLTEEQRVFSSNSTNNVKYTPDNYTRPCIYYVPDAMYYTAWRISRTMQGYDQFSLPSHRSNSVITPKLKVIYDKYMAVSDEEKKEQLLFILSAHIYNGIRIPIIYDHVGDFYLDAINTVGSLDTYSKFNIDGRYPILYLMSGSPAGNFDSSGGTTSPFTSTLAETVDAGEGTNYVQVFSEDYAQDLNKNPAEFWTYSMFALNSGSNILNSLNSLYTQIATIQGPVDNGAYLWPVPEHTTISSPFELRISPIHGRWESHNGLDIPAPKGTEVVATKAGTVIIAGWVSGFGKTVIIDHGDGVTSLYGHNSKLVVNTGDIVTQGQVICEIGNTGNSRGNHCHFTIKVNGVAKDPKIFVNVPAE